MYYVYELVRPNKQVFYVGKGKGYRINQHEWEAKTGKTTNPHKVNVIKKIWEQGGEVEKRIVFNTEDEEAAFEKERELIQFYGRDNLTNLTDGGEGWSGFVRTEEHKKKLAELWTAERRKAHGEARRGQARDSDAGAKHALFMRDSNTNAKTWEGFVDPFGVEHPNIVNLYRWCEEHDLVYYSMLDLHNGGRDHCRGWRKIDKLCWSETHVIEEKERRVPVWLEEMVAKSVRSQVMYPNHLPPLKPNVKLTTTGYTSDRETTFEKISKIMYELRKYKEYVIL